MTLLAGLLIVGALFESAQKPIHFDVTAAFTPARRHAAGEIAVQFVALDPDVKINEVPAPRLKMQSGPATVVAPVRPAVVKDPARDAARDAAADAAGHYLDLTLPVTFPVTLDPATPRGAHDAKGTVTYFYCSKREGWCRKGTAEIGLPISVP